MSGFFGDACDGVTDKVVDTPITEDAVIGICAARLIVVGRKVLVAAELINVG